MNSFFGVSIWEILLIFVLIMIFVGPKNLPKIATKLGRGYRKLKQISNELTTELMKESTGTGDQKIENPLRKAASELGAEVGSMVKDLRTNEPISKAASELGAEVGSMVKDLKTGGTRETEPKTDVPKKTDSST